ncbi:MAG: amidohydrolase [Clostridia bacterium]|nr:amidohydrolase [Clostridia bacterium]
MNKILIKNAKALLWKDGKFEISEQDIFISGNKIEKIGKISETESVEVIDGNHRLVIPGLINTHSHAAMSLFRNYKDDVNLQDWLFHHIFPIEDKLKAGDTYWFNMLSIAEMIRSGITAFADMYFFMDDLAKAVKESGIRANISRSVSGTDDFSRETDYRMQEMMKLFRDYHNTADGRLKVSIAPHSIYTCEKEYLRECGNITRELGCGMQIHMCETLTEVENCQKTHGMTPFEYCESIGLFDGISPIIAAHCVHLSDADIEIIKKHNINVSHNPTSNLKLASGVMDVERLMNSGVTICLGTDGPGSNNKLDILSEMRLAGLIHKGVQLNPTLLSAGQVIAMATVNGAKALQEDIGVIEEGKIADLCLLDIDQPRYYPFTEERLLSALVYSANSADITDVIVDGKVLMRKKELVTIDEEKVKFEVGRKVECLI